MSPPQARCAAYQGGRGQPDHAPGGHVGELAGTAVHRSAATVTADTAQAAPAAGHTGATAPAKTKAAAVCPEGVVKLSGRS